jgi:hypothetical protein
MAENGQRETCQRDEPPRGSGSGGYLAKGLAVSHISDVEEAKGMAAANNFSFRMFGGGKDNPENDVRARFWQTAKRAARQVPFMDEVVAAYYCALDRHSGFSIRPRLHRRCRGADRRDSRGQGACHSSSSASRPQGAGRTRLNGIDLCHSGADVRLRAETKSQTLAVFPVLNCIWDERRVVQTAVASGWRVVPKWPKRILFGTRFTIW